MSQHINLLAFGTFGSPNGFTQSFFAGNNNLARSIKTFDLKTDAIKLYANSKELYSIRNESANGNNAISYCIYTFAKEQNSDRGGTFIGSAILFINKIADENVIIKCLNEFHTTLVKNNVENDVIKVNHSANFIEVERPTDFNKLNTESKEIEDLNFSQSSNKNLVVYSITNTEKLQQLFKKSLDLLNVYDSIYFTSSNEVAEFVLQKGIFKLVKEDGLDQEIQKLHEERKQKRESSRSEFENEKQKLETDRKRLIENHNYQIEQNEKSHKENARKIEESKKELVIINQKYDAYSKKIDESINNLKLNQKLEKVRQAHNENKKLFIDSLNHQTPLAFNKISKHQAKTELKQNFQPTETRGYEQNFPNQEHRGRRKSKSTFFKLLSSVLFLLWVVTLTYFLFFQSKEENVSEVQVQPKENEIQTVEQPNVDKVNTTELSPDPNAELNENDYRIVAKKITKNMPVKDIVQIIFDANPTDIKSAYLNQTDEYAKKIVELNKDCFKEDSNKFFFLKDTLRHIPSYKK